MSDPKEFFSFDEALKHLRLKDEELKRLVSEGEIRAFRDGETMKLRRQDVEHLARELMGGEEIELGGTAEDLLFEDDADLDPGMATQELSAADTLLAEDDLLEADDLLAEEQAELEEEEAEDDYEDQAELQPAEAAQEDWTPLSMVLVLATALILMLTLPILISMSSDHASELAKAVGGLVVKFDAGG